MNKSISKLNFIIKLEVYPFEIMVSFGETNEEIYKRLSQYNLTKGDIKLSRFETPFDEGRAVLFSTSQSLIRLRTIPKSAEDYGTLQHEIFHCVTFIMDNIGMKFELEKSDEAYAYLIGYVTSQIYNKLNKLINK